MTELCVFISTLTNDRFTQKSGHLFRASLPFFPAIIYLVPTNLSVTMIRTPSIHSQNDPITEALKPPPSETEAERIARLAAEAEARRISEKIDEDLREEREHLRRKKGDVKVSTRPALFSGAYTHCLSSCCFSVKLKAANQHFRSSSS